MGCSGLKNARKLVRCMTEELWKAIDVLDGLKKTTRGGNRQLAQLAFDAVAFAGRLGLAKHTFVVVDDSSLYCLLTGIPPLGVGEN